MERETTEGGKERAFIGKKGLVDSWGDSETERSYETCHISKLKMSERLAAMLTGAPPLKKT